MRKLERHHNYCSVSEAALTTDVSRPCRHFSMYFRRQFGAIKKNEASRSDHSGGDVDMFAEHWRHTLMASVLRHVHTDKPLVNRVLLPSPLLSRLMEGAGGWAG